MSDHTNPQATPQEPPEDFAGMVLRLHLPWLQSGTMRGPAFTMGSLVTLCRNEDHTWNPRIWQIAERSGVSYRRTEEHLRILKKTHHITRTTVRKDKPVRTTVSTDFLKDLYLGKYLELPADMAVDLGIEGHKLGLITRCVAASIWNEKKLLERLAEPWSTDDAFDTSSPTSIKRISRELRIRPYRVEESIEILRAIPELNSNSAGQ